MTIYLDESKYLPYAKTTPGLRDIAEYVNNVITEVNSATVYVNFGGDKNSFGYRFNYTKIEVTRNSDYPNISIIVDRPEYLTTVDLDGRYITFTNNDGNRRKSKTTIYHGGLLKEFLIDVSEKLRKIHQSNKD